MVYRDMAAKNLRLLATLELPDGVRLENLEGIEVKVTTKKGEELSGECKLAHFDHESVREEESLRVELSTLVTYLVYLRA